MMISPSTAGDAWRITTPGIVLCSRESLLHHTFLDPTLSHSEVVNILYRTTFQWIYQWGMLPVVTYPTAEHYYQHAKAMSLGLPGEADEILHAD